MWRVTIHVTAKKAKVAVDTVSILAYLNSFASGCGGECVATEREGVRAVGRQGQPGGRYSDAGLSAATAWRARTRNTSAKSCSTSTITPVGTRRRVNTRAAVTARVKTQTLCCRAKQAKRYAPTRVKFMK